MDKQVFAIKEAAAAIGVSKTVLYELMKEGQIPYHYIGRKRLITIQALEDYSQFHYEHGFVGPVEVDDD